MAALHPGVQAGLWRSLVAHLTGGQGVAGSNPVSPTAVAGSSHLVVPPGQRASCVLLNDHGQALCRDRLGTVWGPQCHRSGRLTFRGAPNTESPSLLLLARPAGAGPLLRQALIALLAAVPRSRHVVASWPVGAVRAEVPRVRAVSLASHGYQISLSHVRTSARTRPISGYAAALGR
jgi:hypothetical protein